MYTQRVFTVIQNNTAEEIKNTSRASIRLTGKMLFVRKEKNVRQLRKLSRYIRLERIEKPSIINYRNIIITEIKLISLRIRQNTTAL